jgi:hypothetical protein
MTGRPRGNPHSGTKKAGTTPQHSKKTDKTSDRRAGVKSTRASKPAKARQAPKTQPPKRRSGLSGKPTRSKELARAERKGQNPRRTNAKRGTAA